MGGRDYRDGTLKDINIPLKKIEAEIVRRYAQLHYPAYRTGKPRVGKAVADLLRVAFNCFREHPDRYQDPAPITKAQAREEDLRTAYRESKLRHHRRNRRPGPAKRVRP